MVSSDEHIRGFRKFLKVEMRRLLMRHRSGAGGTQVAAWRSSIVDTLVGRVGELAGESPDDWNGLAVLAVGGYGRAELSPHSDIDLLFLCEDNQGRSAALAQRMLHSLWDCGLEPGHSLRNIDDCLALSNEDLCSRNALIDARRVFGSQRLARQLEEALQQAVFGQRPQQHLEELLAAQCERYEKFGSAVSLQEPNIKESAGGLRDLHTLLWAGRLALGCPSLATLQATGELAGREVTALHRACAHLFRIRNEMHFSTARRVDLLTLDLQEKVAGPLGYRDAKQALASEQLMRGYYKHAHVLHEISGGFLQRLARRLGKPSQASRAIPAGGGLVIQDGVLEFAREGPVAALDPAGLLSIFHRAQLRDAPLGPVLRQAVRRRLAGVDRAVRSSPQNAETFLEILSRPGRVGWALRQMHETEFLGRYIPEFGRISCLVQHDLYHKYTIDEHTLRALENLDALSETREPGLAPFGEVYRRLASPALLHLAVLLHDVGKGLGGGHVEKGAVLARRFCHRLKLSDEQAACVEFLVREHLAMSYVSQRRDLSDAAVVRSFVDRVETRERLDMLLLLTYADTSAVSPDAWTGWKSALVLDLYDRAHYQFLIDSGRAAGEEDAEARLAEVAGMLSGEVEIDAVRRHLAELPVDLLRLTSAQVLAGQVRLIVGLQDQLLRTLWRQDPLTGCSELTICSRNREGLFAAIAGALAAEGVTILSAQLRTRSDQVVLDTFQVRQIDGAPVADAERCAELDAAMHAALSGQVNLASLVAQKITREASRFRKKPGRPEKLSIVWDHAASQVSTVLEVQARDRLGLAYTISSTLAGLHADIVFAKMATVKNRALDVFYIVDRSGRKLDPESCATIEQALTEALSH